jgi:DNA-binding IclR family transcriptional regulator
MTRDEVLLVALAKAESSTAELAKVTGLSERACRYRLHHLIGVDYVWTPARGLYRLTPKGRTMAADLAMTSSQAVAGEQIDAPDEARKRPLPWLVGRRA